ncbi:GNAT family N-acetyltransferase [Paenibacillus barengoltzii]|jgi:GNAT superfamily N-acetyltransferase|uniref:Acetyltransferase (GNAT) family protein n=1 Tax=Paenibacillus barengoltzii J12 TaxID=935846 RepID=A0ABY1M3U9_9BACL|nr:GNAT family N-acetyltransferase [Paenibacillus barengoltzii]SMF68249.1 Acetyltransferase (GNAT) family protein [Paenibacillus barengoltzii J12]
MSDMLVKLYDLPPFETAQQYEARTGITIRRAIGPEKHVVAKWVGEHFNEHWVSECEVALSRSPVSCIIAVENGKLLGFACYDATMKGFFGPTGVDEKERGRGIGKQLLLHTLDLMRIDGYGYAVIGGAGPKDFYAKATGAIVIEGSEPGIYKGMLR